jgi:hypothetical protein
VKDVFRFFLLVLLSSYAKAGVAPRFFYPTDARVLITVPWQTDFVRYPSVFNPTAFPQKKIFCAEVLKKIVGLDVHYLENHSHAQTEFYKWYLSDSIISYVEQLRAQHLLSALGQKTKPQIYHHISEEFVYQSSSSNPGRFRVELDAGSWMNYKFSPSYKQWTLLFEQGFSQPGIYFEGEKINSDLIVYPVRSRGIDEKFSNQIHLRHSSAMYVAPLDDSESVYRKASSDRMADLKKWREKTPHEAREALDDLLNELSDYYHTAIQWMPFSMINNSILMGHVNVLLRHFGLNPMPHEDLDELAFLCHYDPFRSVFKHFVYKANPALSPMLGVRKGEVQDPSFPLATSN